MAKPDKAFLHALFGKEPEAAVRYLESKGLRITWNWGEMLDEAHARAFTVAKAARLDIVQDIRRGVIDAAKNGKTLKQFSAELTPQLQAKGWWGKQVIVDGQGNAEMVQLGSPRRLKTIYQTNLQSAYMAGRMQAQMAADAFPYLQYVAVLDGRTRPSHRDLDGKVFRKDDPIWQSIYPPNGHNCRCRTRALTERQMSREGFTAQSSEGMIVTRAAEAGLDKRTGEVFTTEQTGVRIIGQDGKPTTMWVDQGFNSSPLAGHWMDEILAKKAVAALGDEAGFKAVEKLVLSPTRMKAWEGFVANTLNFGRIQGQTMTVGILPLEVARAAAVFSPVLHVPDRLIVGKKAARHSSSGDALSKDEWISLPKKMAAATWYEDSETGDLIAELGASYLMVSRTGAADSAYHDAAARQKIASGRWKKVVR